MKDPIIKREFHITVLHRKSDPFPDDWDIDTIYNLISDGPMIGVAVQEDVEELMEGKRQIRKRLKDMGNDGTFFDAL